MEFDFIPQTQEPDDHQGPALWFVFQGGDLLVMDDGQGIMIPQVREFSQLGVESVRQHFLGTYQSMPVYSVEVATEYRLPPGYQALHLRHLLGEGEDELFNLAGRAKQVLEWDRDHQFCSRCGTPTQYHDRDRAKICPQCDYHQYPKLNPCVIVLITRGNEVLLGRSPHFPHGMYSTLAGFIEPGEAIETALMREVWEEVGIGVQNLRYMGSQPWPFPHSLMIGFHAEYAGGEIQVDGEEIVDAQWFPIDRLPKIPPPGSISRELIDAYVDQFSRW